MYKRIGMVVVLAVLLMGSIVPAYAWHGRHGYHGRHGFHGRHAFRRPSVVIVPRVVVPFWAPYAYPHVVVAPPPVYVQPQPRVYVPPPPPQPYWYYCDNPSGYYPYVPQCPTGWRQVSPSPP